MPSNPEQDSIFLNIYGFKIRVRTALADSAIRHEFSYFGCEKETPNLLIEQVSFIKASKGWKGLWIGKSRMCDVYQRTWTERVYVYRRLRDGAINGIARYESREKKIQIYTDDADLFFEVAYMMILSLSGEFLEKTKIMRLHALSFTKNQKTFCFWGRRKAGKSTLAQALIDQDSAQIFSDEMSLYDLKSERILPFPIRIALEKALKRDSELLNERTPRRHYLDEKVMYDVPPDRVAEASRLDHFFILNARRGVNKISILGIKDEILFFPQIFLGLGLIQMWEYLVRPDNIFDLFKILFHRTLLYANLRNKNFSIWKRADDLSENFQYLQKKVFKEWS